MFSYENKLKYMTRNVKDTQKAAQKRYFSLSEG